VDENRVGESEERVNGADIKKRLLLNAVRLFLHSLNTFFLFIFMSCENDNREVASNSFYATGLMRAFLKVSLDVLF